MRPDVKVRTDIDIPRIKDRYNHINRNLVRVLKNEIAKDTEPFVPFRDGWLRRSVMVSLMNDEPKIVYATVKARFLYYGKVMVGKITRRSWAKKGETKETVNRDLTYSQGGSFWFEKSKKANLDKWLKIAKKLYK